MPFKTRKIRHRRPLRALRSLKGIDRHKRNAILAVMLALAGAWVVWRSTMAAYRWVADFDPKTLVMAAGSELERDPNGFTNIVLLGDGGHERDGADLVDTIMVASIDHAQGSVALFSIPRDYYVDYPGTRPGKINELYRNSRRDLGEEQAFELFQKVTGRVVNLEIPYYIRVDFTAFTKAVDAMGGITVDVKKPIYDPYYPNAFDDGYTLFEMPSGPQSMDGETALKFVRSRKTTSDFSRAFRQQQMLEALREKAFSARLLSDPGALKELYETVTQNINTNLSIRDMISLAGVAQKINRSKLISKVIHDDPTRDGGFLYTPERQYYNDQFVLVPFGDNLDAIHRYARLAFFNREAFYKPLRIAVFNASHLSGAARNLGYQLSRYGFDVQSVDNLLDMAGERMFLETTEIRLPESTDAAPGEALKAAAPTLRALQEFVETGKITPGRARDLLGAELAIVIGDDFQSKVPFVD